MISSFQPLFALFILWNLAAFLMVMLDKRRARRNDILEVVNNPQGTNFCSAIIGQNKNTAK